VIINSILNNNHIRKFKVSMCKATTCKNVEDSSWEDLAADVQDNLRCYITRKLWTFFLNISFHFAQLILFITVDLFLTITIRAPSSYLIVSGAIMMQYIVLGFNFYHKRNILCWEISAMFEFCCLSLSVWSYMFPRPPDSMSSWYDA